METNRSSTGMSAATKYTLDEVSAIMFNGFTHALDTEVMATIQQLAEQVGAADYVRTPQFQKSGNAQRSRRKGRGGQDVSDQDWEAIRRFQATEIVRKEGVEAAIDKVRVYLNKITDATFETQKEKIFDEIQKLGASDIVEMDDSETADNLRRVSEALFVIASNNSFFSSLYADLYKDLVSRYGFLRGTLDERLDKLDSLFDGIEWCDPQQDYDRFCDVNKANDSRRALALFYVNLMKRELIPEERIAELTRDLQQRLLKEKDQADRTPVVEELSELIGVLVVNCWTPDKSWSAQRRVDWIARWRLHFFMYDNVCELASMKARDHIGLSNKTVFKHMDIRDALNKLMSES